MTSVRAESQVEAAAEAGLLVPEHDVLGDREHGDEHEVLVDHTDARAHGVAGAGEVLDVIVEQDLAFVGLVQTVEDVHQGGLARPIFAQQAVDFAGFDGQVDVVVGDQGTEFLRDAAKFELHGFRFYERRRQKRRQGAS